MFIAKYLAHCGVCSRRNAIELVRTSQVLVNNKVVTDVTYVVKPTDRVKFENKIVKLQPFKYILLNKPRDYVTTLSDERGRRTVLDLIKEKKLGRIYPVGRLDRMTTGLLVLTNDGEFAQRISHPKYNITKGYHVVLDKPFEYADLMKLSKGVRLFDGFAKPDSISYSNKISKRKVTIKIHSGKKRIIRRLFERLGYEVEKLDRFMYAGLIKKDLPIGVWRYLRQIEIDKLLG